MTGQKTVFIAAISSDIGQRLVEHYLQAGYAVLGTYRNPEFLNGLDTREGVSLFQCDLADDRQITAVSRWMSDNDLTWDIFISAVGLLSPIGPFAEADVRSWKSSVILNSLQQAQLLHTLLPFRKAGETGKVAFLVGGAINRAFPNYSAYSLGKVLLVKFCELLSDEEQDLHCVAIGTGWVASKIHEQTLTAGDKAGDNLTATREFVEAGEQGTPVSDIYELINWCFCHPETAGRNFSVVHDRWRDGGKELLASLAKDQDMFRLRRHANQHKGG